MIRPMTRPIVLLDADGPLFDFVAAALGRLYDITGRTYDPKTITTWEIFESLPEREWRHKDTVYDLLKAPGGCRSIPPHPIASEAVYNLQRIAEVLVVTSPFNGSPTWTHEREEALERHFSICHTNVIHAKRKGFIRGDFLVDDKFSNVQEWLERNPEGRGVYWKSLPHDTKTDTAHLLLTQDWNLVINEVKLWTKSR